MPLMKQISKLIPDTNVLLSHLNENKHNWGSVKDNDDTYLSTNR